VLLKSAVVAERLADVDVVALDKTGRRLRPLQPSPPVDSCVSEAAFRDRWEASSAVTQ
jgi:hypothetical protein